MEQIEKNLFLHSSSLFKDFLMANKIYNLRKVSSVLRRLFNEFQSQFITIIIDSNDFYPEKLRISKDFESRLFTLPIHKGRALPIHTLDYNGFHPFVYAAKEALRVQKADRYTLINNILSKYFFLFSPETAGHLLSSEKESNLYKYPSWAVIMPWQLKQIDEWALHVRQSVKHENNHKFGIENGWAWSGPSSVKKITIESKRLSSLLNSILINGYKRHNGNDGDISVAILYKNNSSWVWQAIAAQHRACVLSALGCNEVKVRIAMFVKRDEVATWPQVVNGFFTIAEALDIFDKVFDGGFYKNNIEWDNYIKLRNECGN
mgnify:CR=1 FL=1